MFGYIYTTVKHKTAISEVIRLKFWIPGPYFVRAECDCSGREESDCGGSAASHCGGVAECHCGGGAASHCGGAESDCGELWQHSSVLTLTRHRTFLFLQYRLLETQSAHPSEHYRS